ncbi:M14 family zinc carboxypeptidase [Laceyella putida]|uniref:M14 family zinc carboxypeptidase n=1 Tax=Laceyella putida TaxID=110101 RepID=A0ABW2RHM7_9BACL
MQKQLIASLLTLSLFTLLPQATYSAQPFSHEQTQQTADQEADRSLFNSEHYDFVKYSKIGTLLDGLSKQSNRIKVERKGKSAEGRDLYVVTISEPSAKGKYGHYKALRKQMFKNPEKAQAWVDKHPDFKVPIMINASIHGTEFVGSDTALQLIKRFALDHDPETEQILKNNILIFNVVANPDGRFHATRFNGAGIDLNRDFITQSQPETKLAVDLITEWNPMVLFDLHGYVNGYDRYPGLIEPCTPPHNPNYEYDLFSKWALQQATEMEKEIVANKQQYSSDLYKNMSGTYIPARPLPGQDSEGWDDYPPIFTPMYAMYHGSYAYTLEAPTNDWDGVRWHYDAVMGGLRFATQHRVDMIKYQIEIFKRGIRFNHPNHPENFFPSAYILPISPQDATAVNKAVNHLLANDIQVEEAIEAFHANGKDYPKGTYVVPMDQAKAGLANTMLWKGEDISDQASAMYDISAWNLPELWGFEAIPAKQEITVRSKKVNPAVPQGKLVGKGTFHIPNRSVKAVKLANDLVRLGIPVKRDQQGDFYFPSTVKDPKITEAVKRSGLTLHSKQPSGPLSPVSKVKVAMLEDGGMWKQQSHAGTKLALERLGFEVTALHPREVAKNGLGDADVFIYAATDLLLADPDSLELPNKEFGLESKEQIAQVKERLHQFVDKGGKYIAIGAGASHATSEILDLTDVSVHVGPANANGIVKVDTFGTSLTLGYSKQDIGFVYDPVWYTGTEHAQVVAAYANTPDFFVAGHWKNRNQAQGQAVIVKEKEKDVTLIGLEPGFRDHTDYLFRLLSNAIVQ